MRVVLPLLLLSLAPTLDANAEPGALTSEPFGAIEELRSSLAAKGPSTAHFEQTFVPAGFSSGETESGTLALGLPKCLRWDYREPLEKSFLLCDLELYSWNVGEPSGQLVALDNAEQPGLDLLLLPRERLVALYSATLTAKEAGSVEVALTPRDPATSPIAAATLVLDGERSRIESLSWRDREGNQTTFIFSQWQSCPECSDDATFTAPRELTWEVRRTP